MAYSKKQSYTVQVLSFRLLHSTHSSPAINKKPPFLKKMVEFHYQFEKGEEVEVMMDGKGFRGALFEAKVVTARRKGNTKISIQYHHLVEEEESMKPLREYVDIVNVRPTPPRDSVEEFKFNNLVDCFHDDAWWEGVITQVRPNGGRFLVYFRTTQEEIEFSKEAMRLHREWSDRDGSWNPPPGAAVVEMDVEEEMHRLQPPPHEQAYSCNKVGDQVEVAGGDDEHSGSWFTATVVGRGSKRGRLLVEYQCLNEDGDDRYRLREEADVRDVRPLPPDTRSVMAADYRLGERVDVRYKDGWWCSGGVVIQVSGDLRNYVRFSQTGEVMRCYHSQLRVHREWDSRNGSWNPPPSAVVEEEHEQLQAPPNQASSTFGLQLQLQHSYSCNKVGDEVEVAGKGEYAGSWFTAVIAKKKNNRKFMVHYQNLDAEGDDGSLNREGDDTDVVLEADVKNIRPLPPGSEEVECFSLGQEVDAQYADGWWCSGGVISKVLTNLGYTVRYRESKEEVEYDHFDLRLHREWDYRNGTWDPPLLAAEGVEQLQPPPKQITKNSYSCSKVGDRVEIAGKGGEHSGSWFAATIVERLNKRWFLVEYQSLNVEGDCAEPLREGIDIRKVRPLPPDSPADFMLEDEVDVEYKDGWWCSGGVISKVLSDSKFMVRFRQTEEELEYDESQLRLHLDWVPDKRKWVQKDTLEMIPEERSLF